MGYYNDQKGHNPNIYNTKFGKGLSHSGKIMQKQIAKTGDGFLSSEFLTPAYQIAGRQQSEAMRGLNDTYGQALGSNTSGMLANQQAQVTQQAPYGAANIAARQAGFDRFQQLTNGLERLKSLENVWRNTRTGEAQGWESLALQEEAIDNQQFLAGAGAGASGGSSGTGGLLGGLLGGILGSGGGGGGGII